MDKNEINNKIINQIWDVRRRIHMWNFIFGKDSSQSKVDEFTQYFTNWVSYELQECLEKRILIDLRGLMDKSSDNVMSIFKIFDKKDLKKAEKVFTDIRKYVNNVVVHKNEKATFSYTFKDIDNTLNELQNLIDNQENYLTIRWDVTHLMGYELDMLYKKVKIVNDLEKQNKLI